MVHKFVVHKFVYQRFFCVYLHILQEGWLFDDIAPA